MRDLSVILFRALADVTRQEILEILEREEECCVTDLCALLDHLTQPTVSHHLQILRRCDLVVTNRKGKLVYYALNKRSVKRCFDSFTSRFNL